MSKRLRDYYDRDNIKRYKISDSALAELTAAFSQTNIKDDADDAGVEEITRGVSDFNLGPINLDPITVVIIPFAHGGVRQSALNEQKLIEGMNVKLITSTPGTCTLIKPNSYVHLLSTTANIVKSKNSTTNVDYDNQLLENFNTFQNYVVDETISSTPTRYIPKLGKNWHSIPSKQVPEGYIYVVSNTYAMTDFNDINTNTKNYSSIPQTDPLWTAFLTVAKLLKIDPTNYSEKVFVIYMYIDQNGYFKIGITPNTTANITLNQILYNTNESIKNKLGGRDAHYIFADPNCAYGDENIKFGGRSSKKTKKRNYKKTNKRNYNYKKKSRKVRKGSRKVRKGSRKVRKGSRKVRKGSRKVSRA